MIGTQESLFHETLADAIGAAVAACGGFKKVATALWPAMKGESAYARLKACLDDLKPEKLTLGEIVEIARLAKEEGCHAIMNYLGSELAYEVRPVEPKEDAEARMAQIIEAQRMIQKNLEALARRKVR